MWEADQEQVVSMRKKKLLVKSVCYFLSFFCASGCVLIDLVGEFNPIHLVGAVSWFVLGWIYE